MGNFGKGTAHSAGHDKRDGARCDSRAIQSVNRVGGPAAGQSLIVFPVFAAS